MKLDPKIGRSLKKASPTILTCIGAAGVVATAVLAVKATPKADSLIKADSRRNHDGDPYAATKLEAVKSCWKCYIPAAATGVATIICIFGANTLNKKQQASLASAYALVNRSYSDYKHKLKELYGEDAHKKIMESIAAEKSSMPPITAMGPVQLSKWSHSGSFVPQYCGDDRDERDRAGRGDVRTGSGLPQIHCAKQ